MVCYSFILFYFLFLFIYIGLGGPVNNMHQQRTSAHPSGGGNPYGYANYGSKSYMQQPMQRMSMTMSTNEMGGRPMSSVNMTQGRPMMTSSMGSQRGSMTSSQATRGHPSNMPRYGPGPSMMGNMYNSQGGTLIFVIQIKQLLMNICRFSYE